MQFIAYKLFYQENFKLSIYGIYEWIIRLCDEKGDKILNRKL